MTSKPETAVRDLRSDSLDPLLAPRGVAIVGASQDPTKLGYGAARNLIVSGYQGEVYFINPRGGTLFDRQMYADIREVPDPVDLAVILIPAPAIPDVLLASGERGVRAAIIGSGGFREVGPEGAALEQQCLAIVREYGIATLGPNCIGHLDTHLPIDTTFLPLPGPIPGDISFLSQSGAICEAVIDWARGQGFGLARLISLGNQMDLTEAQVLPAVADDPNTKVIAMYLEGVDGGRGFVTTARQVVQQKPVVAIKVGRSEKGRQAVASHTGALAGTDEAYQAAFHRAGVLRAQTSEEMFDWARALAWCPLPRGRRMAVLTNAGGPGAIAVDALEDCGLEMAELADSSIQELIELLPPAASVANPVDMLASAGPREYAQALKILLADQGVDAVMVILPPPPMTTAAEVAGAMIPQVKASSKPVVVALMGEELIAHAARLFRQTRVPDYRFPERAASALRVLVSRAEQLNSELSSQPIELDLDLERAHRIVDAAQVGSDGFLDPQSSAELAACAGIATPPSRICTNLDQAFSFAESNGYPVALKIADPSVTHKSDAGGVRLNLISVGSLTTAFDELQRLKAPDGSAQRPLLIQTMAGPGQDVILGATQDATFGTLLMFGSGGVEVEALGDVSFALGPVTDSDCERLLDETWAGRRLRGFRNLPPADREQTQQAIVRLGLLAEGLSDQVADIEINPLRVFGSGSGVLALDVRVRVRAIAGLPS